MKNFKRNFTMLLVTFMILTLLPITTVFAAATSLTIAPKSIAYSADLDLFAIVGTSNLVLTSKDGTNWAKRVVTGISSTLGSGNQGALAWGNNMFVGTTGTAGKVLLSDKTGSNWRVVSTNNATDQIFSQICYEPTSGYFVAGAGTLANTKLWKSTNALDWTEIAFVSNYLSGQSASGTFYSIIQGESGVVYGFEGRSGGAQRVHKISDISSATPTVIYNQVNKLENGGFTSGANLYAGGKLYTGDANTTTTAGFQYMKELTFKGNGSYITTSSLNTDATVDQNFSMGGMASNGNYVLAFPSQSYITQTGLTTNISVFSAGVSGGTADVKVTNLLSDTDRAKTYIMQKYPKSTNGPGYAVAAKPNSYFVAVLNSGVPWNFDVNNYWNILKIDNVNYSAATPTYNLGITNQYDNAVGEISITGNSSVPIPASGSSTLTYTASVVNSSNVAAPSETVTWSTATLPTGVSFNTATGVLTVDSNATAGDKVTIFATSNSQTSVVKTLEITLTKKPLATNVSVSGTPLVGNTLTGTYLITLNSGTLESGSTYRWLASSSATDFSTATVLASGNCSASTPISYVIDVAAQDKYIKLEVTPRSDDVIPSQQIGDTVLSGATIKVQGGTEYIAINDTFEGATGSGSPTVTLSDGAVWAAVNRNIFLSSASGDGLNTSTYLYGVYGVSSNLTLNRNLPMNLTSANGKVAVDVRVKTADVGKMYYLHLNDSSSKIVARIVVKDGGMYYGGEYLSPSAFILNQETDFATTANTWYNMRFILDFSTSKVKVYIGTSADDLRLLLNSKPEFNFYANGASGSYTMADHLSQIQFQAGNSGTTYPAGIDDVKVAFASNKAVPSAVVTLNGTAQIGQTLTGSYVYTGDTESNSIYVWLTSTDPQGKNNITKLESGITNASASTTYTVKQSDAGKYISLRIIPKTNAAMLSSIGDVAIAQTTLIPGINPGAMQLFNGSTAITSIGTGGDIKGSTYVVNAETATISAVLILAHYKAGQLVGIVMSPRASIDIGTGATLTTPTVAVDQTHTGETLKLFLWSNTGNVLPITGETTIN